MEQSYFAGCIDYTCFYKKNERRASTLCGGSGGNGNGSGSGGKKRREISIHRTAAPIARIVYVFLRPSC
uniref:Uncharacterized protein n=1 Tax=Trichogramma kaykai TaxID=54128 RepID=A0ABD2W8F9_9HYME